MSQLYEDLSAIRKSQKLSVQDLHDKTRLAMHTIQEIENGSIFTTESNKTYTRSYVRTYARALGLDDKLIIRALNANEAGSYDGMLIKKNDDSSSSSSPAEQQTPNSTGSAATNTSNQKQNSETEDKSGSENDPSDAKAIQTPGQKTPPATKPEPSVKATRPTESASEERPQTGKAKVLDGSTIGPGKTGPVNIPSGRHTPPPPTSADVNWSNLSRNASRPGKGLPIPAILGGIILLLIIGGLIYWLSSSSGNDEVMNENETETSGEFARPGTEFDELLADTLDAPLPPDPSLAAAAALPDTLSVVIYAATGNLEPFRVSSDIFENRRPYWIERGVGMRIKFVDEISVSGNFNRMILLFGDRVITEFDEINQNGERIIRRSQFDGDPTLESFTEAELPQGVQEPREVIDRPIIN